MKPKKHYLKLLQTPKGTILIRNKKALKIETKNGRVLNNIPRTQKSFIENYLIKPKK